MLDELLGRAALKGRIADLEEENERLRRRLDAEAERRAEAQRARQDAEERVNRLEDRIADLEGQLERHREDAAADLAVRRRETVSGARLEAVLSRLESVEAGAEGALTAMVADGIPEAVREAFGEHAALVARAAPCLALADDAGLVSAALVPPVAPDPFVEWADGFVLDRAWFLPAGEFALALVRADLFAMGEYEGRERRAFRGFESDVRGDHSKGGFSQARFERRRDEQIDEHLEQCREAVEDRGTDRLYVVGDRRSVAEFADVADATAAVDATGAPEEALSAAFHEFWSARLYGI